MATMASAPTSTATITPPRSSHGHQDSWGFPAAQKEDFQYGSSAIEEGFSEKPHHAATNGNPLTHEPPANRRMHSSDRLAGGKRERSVDKTTGSYHNIEHKASPGLDDGWGNSYDANGDEPTPDAASAPKVGVDEDSKWIHRDKLAKIESEELQAAGIYIPRTRATSKPRRDRSRSAMRRGTDASEHHRPQSRKNSTAMETRSVEPLVNTWDLRTPEEIAEEESNAYFTPSSKSGSRIPVAKISPAPIPSDYLERGSTGARKTSESPEGEPLSAYKTRSRSASMKASDALNGTLPAARRSTTDVSPKKHGARKASATRAGATGRPKTRSGSTKESTGSASTRPSTRSGELLPGNKAPEGDPPWMANSYKPDPRLPPDQQLLPTVAKRLQQERWEKEGTAGDAYDKDFRPLNDNVWLKPSEIEKTRPDDEENPGSQWPLKQEQAKPAQGSYSTVPKMSDKQYSPLPNSRSPVPPQQPPQPAPPQHMEQTPERLPPEPEEKTSKSGCGCCVVM